MSDNSLYLGPYANYYPRGVYDDIYMPEKVEDQWRRSDEDMSSTELKESYEEPTANHTDIESIDDTDSNRNESFTFNDYDDQGLIKKTFGYRLTVYRSPDQEGKLILPFST
jgi:hypothetical protein